MLVNFIFFLDWHIQSGNFQKRRLRFEVDYDLKTISQRQQGAIMSLKLLVCLCSFLLRRKVIITMYFSSLRKTVRFLLHPELPKLQDV